MQLSKKNEIWAAANNQFPVDPNFIWVTMDCQHIPLKQMQTSHIFSSLKMVWNATVPEYARIAPVNLYKIRWPQSQRRYTIRNLFNELMNRPDRTKGMDEALRTMALHIDRFYKGATVATLQQ